MITKADCGLLHTDKISIVNKGAVIVIHYINNPNKRLKGVLVAKCAP